MQPRLSAYDNMRKTMRKTHDEGGEGLIAILIVVDDTRRAASACTQRRVKKPKWRVDVGVKDWNGQDRGRDVCSIQIGLESRVESVEARREEAGLGESGLRRGVVPIGD